MKKNGVRLCLLVAVSFAMVLLISEGSIYAQQQYSLSQYFPLTKGATWTYLRIKTSAPNDIEVNCIAPITDSKFGLISRKFLFDSGEKDPSYSYEDMKWTTTGLKIYRSGDRNLVSVSGGYTLYNPPLKRFPASMSVGQILTQKGTATEYDLNGNQVGSYPYYWKITLKSVETVQTYIGTIANCLKFNIDNGEEKWSIWLASNIGMVKSAEVGQDGRLLSFTKEGKTYYPTP
jgi:hypothetical protein